MGKHEDADLILKLYDLRRETVMREARNWLFTFNPTSIQDVMEVMMGEHGGHFRMVISYWDMACAMVVNGAIDEELFNQTNGEHMFVYMKITSAEFLKSALKEADWPRDNIPEIAFLGRSNVGKSSLINSLLGVRGLARTSSTP